MGLNSDPHDMVLVFKPSPAIPELNVDSPQPFLGRGTHALHPLASPILCPDEMFRSLPPMLMLMSSGEFFRDISMTREYAAYN